ncbi:MAG: hypothetical protein JNK25_01510 [Phycisphaerae bacterium]|nr:hypothetical protein [Phycisphaerae bacterium]
MSLLDLLCCSLGAGILLLLIFVSPQLATRIAPPIENVIVTVEMATRSPAIPRLGTFLHLDGALVGPGDASEVQIFGAGTPRLTIMLPQASLTDVNRIRLFVARFEHEHGHFREPLQLRVRAYGRTITFQSAVEPVLTPGSAYAIESDLASLAKDGGKWEAVATTSSQEAGTGDRQPALPVLSAGIAQRLDDADAAERAKRPFVWGAAPDGRVAGLEAAVGQPRIADESSLFTFGMLQPVRLELGSFSRLLPESDAAGSLRFALNENDSVAPCFVFSSRTLADAKSLAAVAPCMWTIPDDARWQRFARTYLLAYSGIGGADSATPGEVFSRAHPAAPETTRRYSPMLYSGPSDPQSGWPADWRVDQTQLWRWMTFVKGAAWRELIQFFGHVALDGADGGSGVLHLTPQATEGPEPGGQERLRSLLIFEGPTTAVGRSTVLAFDTVTVADAYQPNAPKATEQSHAVLATDVLLEPGALAHWYRVDEGTALITEILKRSDKSLVSIDLAGLVFEDGATYLQVDFVQADGRTAIVERPPFKLAPPQASIPSNPFYTSAPLAVHFRDGNAPSRELFALSRWTDFNRGPAGVGARQHPLLWIGQLQMEASK